VGIEVIPFEVDAAGAHEAVRIGQRWDEFELGRVGDGALLVEADGCDRVAMVVEVSS
jgi:hypothetical protein